MESLTELYRIGPGPSASHTMGPRRAADTFSRRHPDAKSIHCTLYGALAATGRGHLTDIAIEAGCAPLPVTIDWRPTQYLPYHPNGMDFTALDAEGHAIGSWRVYSVGGGALRTGDGSDHPEAIYALNTLEDILRWCRDRKTPGPAAPAPHVIPHGAMPSARSFAATGTAHALSSGAPLWTYVDACEGPAIWAHLARVWDTMKAAIERGLATHGTLPGVLNLKRKSRKHYESAQSRPGSLRATGLLTAYSLAVSEENAAGGVIVTAPTCGACGVLPGVMRYLQETLAVSDRTILEAIATAGLIGNLVKTNASISGAAVGCQGEVGTACAMAAGAAAQLMGGTIQQVEYAAEMGFEHHLGLTCDPIAGLVQIPCIERNAVGATRAVGCAEYAMLTDGEHQISFDNVVETMRRTGADMQQGYRETSLSGLAAVYTDKGKPNQCS
jgi:L-serine dehydratase